MNIATLGAGLPVAFSMPGPMELLIILAIALLLFGAKRLPDIAASIGKSIKEFKNGFKDSDKEAK